MKRQDLQRLEEPDERDNSSANIRVAAQRKAPDGLSTRISAFLKAIRPYRDLLALVLTMVAAVAGGISWTTAYFASRAQVFALECRMYDYIHASLKPIESGLGRVNAKWERKEAARLMKEGKPNDFAIQLLEEAEHIDKEQDTADLDADRAFKSDTANCDRGPQKPVSSR